MANEVEKYNTLALADIEKINGFADADIEKLNGLEYTGATLLKGIFGFGSAAAGVTSITNLVSNWYWYCYLWFWKGKWEVGHDQLSEHFWCRGL